MVHYYSPAFKAQTLEEMKKVKDWECETYKFKHQVPDDMETVDVSEILSNFKGFTTIDGYYKYEYQTVKFLFTYISNSMTKPTCPEINAKDKTISYFENLDKYNRDIKTTCKIGKYIRKVAPYYNDKQVEFIVNIILDEYTVPEYTYNVGKEQEEFKIVYEARAEKGRVIGKYSCLNASCMRDRFSHMDHHPCEVYGSGDFELHYLTNPEGRIAARTILCLKDMVYANVYVSNQQAGEQLEQLIKNNREGATNHRDTYGIPWDGAKLLKLESGGEIVAPYIDVNQSVGDCGSYLEIGGSDYEFCSTSGVIHKIICCEECGDEVHPDDVCYTGAGEQCCDNCVRYCDFIGEYTTENTVEVYSGPRSHQYDMWSESAAQDNAFYDEETEKWCTEDFYNDLIAERENEEDEEEEDDTDDEDLEEVETKVEIEPVFNIGDKIRVIANSTNFHYMSVGDVGVIVGYKMSTNSVCVSFSGLYQYVSRVELEKVDG